MSSVAVGLELKKYDRGSTQRRLLMLLAIGKGSSTVNVGEYILFIHRGLELIVVLSTTMRGEGECEYALSTLEDIMM